MWIYIKYILQISNWHSLYVRQFQKQLHWWQILSHILSRELYLMIWKLKISSDRMRCLVLQYEFLTSEGVFFFYYHALARFYQFAYISTLSVIHWKSLIIWSCFQLFLKHIIWIRTFQFTPCFLHFNLRINYYQKVFSVKYVSTCFFTSTHMFFSMLSTNRELYNTMWR